MTSVLQDFILQQPHVYPDNFIERVQKLWSTLTGSNIPTNLSSHSQKCWDGRVSEVIHLNLLEKFPDTHNRARLLAVSASHSGDWLNALPISACGLRLEDEAVRVAIGLRLGTSLCEPHARVCGAEVDVSGTHSLACKRSAGRMGRHRSSTTSFGVPSSVQTFLPLKNLRVYFVLMENGRMV